VQSHAFFWGSFGLAVTRFSGRRAPRHPGGVPNLADDVVCEAYSHEVRSAGSGEGAIEYPAFYSYIYPVPRKFPLGFHPTGRRLFSAKNCKSSYCLTMPCELPRPRTRRSSHSYKALMKLQPPLAMGTAPRSNARWERVNHARFDSLGRCHIAADYIAAISSHFC
jgi:hypothetical protein